MRALLNKIYTSFVDRDMFMQYRGGGVGHKSTHNATKCLLEDRDKLDKRSFTLEYDRHEQEAEESEESRVSDASMDESSAPEPDEEIGSEDDEESDTEDITLDQADTQAVPDELGDEMEEYGYTGLDQILDDSDEEGNEQLLDREDGEVSDNALEYADL